MRRAVLPIATAVLLAGPTVLAFFAGGYFDGPRSAALVVAWALVLVLALTGRSPLPGSRPGRIAVGALASLGAWTAISLAWAPLIGPAVDGVQRVLLYLGALLAAISLLQDRRAALAVEPVLALGGTVVIGYGVLERLVAAGDPADGSFAAGGRLEQPITYWNAEGLLAAIALTLCMRLAGDRARPAPLRTAAATAAPVLGVGVYLSYSRGALAAALIGAILILAVVPTRPQLRGVLICLAGGLVASACAAALPGVASLEGTPSEIDRDGAIMLVLLVLISALAAFAAARSVGAERRGSASLGRLPFAERLPLVAAAAVSLCVVGLIVGGLLEDTERAGANASRLASVSSLRYEYWRIGAEAFADHPIQGLGGGGFRVYWRQHRDVNAGVTEVHSLELEMAAELGLPGLALLLAFLAGVGMAARRALRRGTPLAAGAFAGCTVWVLHASIDWDWQVPAVTLPAVLLAGALLADCELPDEPAGAPLLADEPQPDRSAVLLR
jgi:hypothetical protein